MLWKYFVSFQALAQLSDADMVYLRGVLVSAFESGAICKEGPMFMASCHCSSIHLIIIITPVNACQ
jgi:hypothetical protein